jgi:adenylosuccinate synthase
MHAKVIRKKAQVYIIIGGAWGDEGKGKVAAFYAKIANLVIRATGGANAGHTLYINGHKVALHLIPGGIGYPGVICLIGQGVALDLDILFQEMEDLRNLGVLDVEERLKISGMATVLMPYHKELDELYERMRENKVGTTKRGIGPAYEDKVKRDGLLVYHLLDSLENLEAVIKNAVERHNILFRHYGMKEAVVDPHALAVKYHEYGERIKKMVVDGHNFVRGYVNDPTKTIVVEGAQAVMLSIETGNRPNYVTSSDSNTNGTLSGAHLSWKDITEVILIYKAYLSRVGNGPFYTELPAHLDADGNLIPFAPEEAKIGDKLREAAGEYGATTGRPRRVGSYDILVGRYGVEVAGADYACFNHMDTIGKFALESNGGFVSVVTSYKYRGEEINYYPFDTIYTHEVPEPCSVISIPGWVIEKDTHTYEDLPENAKKFIEVIEEYIGVPVKYIGIGPKNSDLIVRTDV